MSSLSEFIFGSKVKSKVDVSSSNLFNTSSSLPQKPHFTHFTEPSKRNHKKKRKTSPENHHKEPDDGDVLSKKQKTPAEASTIEMSSHDLIPLKDLGQSISSLPSLSIIPTMNQTKEEGGESSAIDTSPRKVAVKEQQQQQEEEEGDEVDERTIFVSNLPLEITRKNLASIFKSCGKVVSTRLRSIPTQGVKVPTEMAGNVKFVKKVAVNTKAYLKESPKQFAQGYVVFSNPIIAVQNALAMNNQTISIMIGSNEEGKEEEEKSTAMTTIKLRVDHAKPTIDASRSVFVGNLPYAADEQSLRQHFNTVCGWDDDDDSKDNNTQIVGVRIIRDPSTMQFKGFAYVLLKDKISVPEAL